MKLGIFGGTFNPLHNGHLKIAEEAEKQFSLDRIFFVPTCLPPHKVEPVLASAEQRLEMVQLILKGHPKWTCSELEIRRGGASYTIDTLNSFRKENPQANLFLILGADNLLTFNRWREATSVASMASILVYGRPGFPLPENSSELCEQFDIELDYHVIQGAEMKMSSSEIRNSIQNKKNVSGLVPPAVLTYIKEHGLYQK